MTRVLVVDDEPVLRKLIGRAIQPDHDVTAVESAEAALNLIRGGEHFDVIVCDLMMPIMNGMEFYETLQQQNPRDADRIIFLTGGAYAPGARAFLETVTNPKVEKPFNAAGLRSLVALQAARSIDDAR